MSCTHDTRERAEMQSILTPNNINDELVKLRRREGRTEIDDSHKTFELQAVPFYEAPIGEKGLVHKNVVGGGLIVGHRCDKCLYPEKPCVCYADPQPKHWVKLPIDWIKRD